jgi:hypothetical protein
MKKIIVLFVLCFVFIGCSSDDNKESYLFRNGTNFTVKIKPYENLLDGNPDFEFILMPKETKAYQSDYIYSIFKVNSSETERNFSYKFQGDTRVIYDFSKMVEYRVTGSAASANITYTGSNGSTYQSNVSIPHTIGFDYFANDFKYISAQNNTNTGYVKVELYVEDILNSSQTCSSAYCISTASN